MPQTSGATALRTLSSTDLPVRVHGILVRLLRLVDDGLGHLLDRMLMEYELELQRLAEAAPTPDLHGRYLGLLRVTQRAGGELRPRVRARVEDAFARLRDAIAREQAEVAGTPDFSDLRLVEDHHVDERAALKMITTRQEARSGLPLMLLGQRFGVLAGAPAFDAEQLPVGPRRLGQMIADAASVLDMDAPTRLLLLRMLDQQLISHYGALLEAMNRQLIEDGVLPELTFVPIRKTPRLQNRDADPATAEDVLPQVERRAQPRRGGDRPGQGDGGRRSGDRPERSYTAWMGEATEAPGADEQRAAFELLRELLSGRRELLGKLRRPQAPVARADVRAELGGEAVDSGLQQLQAQVREGTASLPGDPQDVRHALLVRNRQATGGGAAFSNADQDTFELLGLLYRQIHREVRAGSPSHDLLNRLMVPLLRVATHDAGFFIDARHPARALLGAVAESGAAWLGPDEIDPQYEAQLRDAVQHVLTFFDGDVRVFEEANHWVEDAAGVLARKAEVSERRFVEAARGKEKLELAKRRAAAAIDEALDAGPVPRFTRSLLCQAWADVLTLVWLRHGEGSDEWAAHLEATHQVVAAAHGTPAPIGLDDRIEQALLLVGYHGDDAALIARHLTGGIDAEDDDAAATRTELALRIKARTRLGADARTTQAGTPATPEQAGMRERLVGLPFGTWIESVDEAGRASRRRLAWFSAETDQALLVNQRGQRVEDTTLEAIARQIVAGQAQIVSAGRGRVVDRAWLAALQALRSFASSPADGTGDTP